MKAYWSAVSLMVLACVLLNANCGSPTHLVSISVSPNPATITSFNGVQLQAIGTFSDGKTAVLSSVNWSTSAPPPQINVSQSGFATCSLGGPVTNQGRVTASVSDAGSRRTVSGSATVFCNLNQV